jgi:phage shock protein C
MIPLHLSGSDKRLTGLCGGIAERCKLDSGLIRALLLLLCLMTGGIAVVVYLLISLTLPIGPHRSWENAYLPAEHPGAALLSEEELTVIRGNISLLHAKMAIQSYSQTGSAD